MGRPQSRSDLNTAMFGAGRGLGTASAMFNHAIAERLGLLPTDWDCLSLLEAGPVPAGYLAKHTGLSTGAITGVIDRLEAAGYVRRARDPNDRRRVLVEPVPEKLEAMIPLFEPMLADMANLNAEYSNDELEVIVESMQLASAVLSEHTLRLRGNGHR